MKNTTGRRKRAWKYRGLPFGGTLPLVALMVACVFLMTEAQQVAAAEKDKGDRGNLALEVSVVDANGQPAKVSEIILWQRNDSASGRRASPPNASAKWKYYDETILWHEEVSGRTWVPVACEEGWDRPVFTGRSPGQYRVTVASGSGDVTPLGVTDVVQLTGRGEETPVRVTARLEGATPLVLKFIDSNTRQPLRRTAFVLFRSDGLPIGSGYGGRGFRLWAGEDGTFRFGSLTAGNYLVMAAKWADDETQPDYRTAENRIRIEVAEGKENVVEVQMDPVKLTNDEIAKRWPFVVTGTVTDGQGRPMPGVRICVARGMGTLWPGCETTSSEDGKYTLRFGPFGWLLNPETGLLEPMGKTAVVGFQKGGYHAKDLDPRGNFVATLELSSSTPTLHGLPVLAADKPYCLDVVMLPTASIKGRVVDKSGRPVANRQLGVFEGDVPTDVGTLARFTSDQDGRFMLPEVPCRSWRFGVGHGNRPFNVGTVKPPWSNALNIAEPKAYDVELIYDAEKPSLEARLVSPPGSGSQEHRQNRDATTTAPNTADKESDAIVHERSEASNQEKSYGDKARISVRRVPFALNEKIPVNLVCPTVKGHEGKAATPFTVTSLEFTDANGDLHCSVETTRGVSASAKFIMEVSILHSEVDRLRRPLEVLFARKERAVWTVLMADHLGYEAQENHVLDFGSIQRFEGAGKVDVSIEDISGMREMSQSEMIPFELNRDFELNLTYRGRPLRRDSSSGGLGPGDLRVTGVRFVRGEENRLWAWLDLLHADNAAIRHRISISLFDDDGERIQDSAMTFTTLSEAFTVVTSYPAHFYILADSGSTWQKARSFRVELRQLKDGEDPGPLAETLEVRRAIAREVPFRWDEPVAINTPVNWAIPSSKPLHISHIRFVRENEQGWVELKFGGRALAPVSLCGYLLFEGSPGQERYLWPEEPQPGTGASESTRKRPAYASAQVECHPGQEGKWIRVKEYPLNRKKLESMRTFDMDMRAH